MFSSLTSEVLSPLVERQAFILPTAFVAALSDTVTEKGITTKHVLMAGSNGAIVSMPRHLLDPRYCFQDANSLLESPTLLSICFRRPNFNTPPEAREPGLPPYVPELSLPHEAVLNYNQSVTEPRGLATAPTGLESTSVVFVYGLDIYCTRWVHQ